MPYDFLSSNVNDDLKLMSSVVRLKLWNPNTQAELTNADLSSGLLITLPGKANQNTYLVRFTHISNININ